MCACVCGLCTLVRFNFPVIDCPKQSKGVSVCRCALPLLFQLLLQLVAAAAAAAGPAVMGYGL